MRTDIYILALWTVQLFVTQIAASYNQSQKPSEPKMIPFNAKEFFKLKTSTQGALNKIEDEKKALQDIWDKLIRILLCMAGSALEFGNFYRNTAVPVLGNTGLYHLPTSSLACDQGKCYIPSTFWNISPLTYYDANQYCISIGGKLAEPFLLENSTFGSDIYRTYSGYFSGNGNDLWINGKANAKVPLHIETGGGFEIPNNFFRYKSIYNYPSTQPSIVDTSALFLVSGQFSLDQDKWFIDVASSSENLPFLCEFRVIYLPFTSDSSNNYVSFGSHNQMMLDYQKKFISTYCLKSGSLDQALRDVNEDNVFEDNQQLSMEDLKQKILSTKFSKLDLKDFVVSDFYSFPKNISSKSKNQKLRNNNFITKRFMNWNNVAAITDKIDVDRIPPLQHEDKNLEGSKTFEVITNSHEKTPVKEIPVLPFKTPYPSSNVSMTLKHDNKEDNKTNVAKVESEASEKSSSEVRKINIESSEDKSIISQDRLEKILREFLEKKD